MKIAKILLPVLALCVLAGVLTTPVFADGYTTIYGGWVDSGKTIQAGQSFVTFEVYNGSSVHATVQSPDYPSGDVNIPKGNSYYYYDALRIYVAEVNGTQAMVDISKPSTSGSSQSAVGTKIWCDIPGQQALGGDTVTFPISIQNNNAGDQTYTLSASGVSGWGSGFQYSGKDVYQIYVPASQTRVVNLVVQTSYSSTVGEKSITVSANGATTDVQVDITSVNQTVDVSTKVDSMIASIGDKIYYDFSLQNLQSQQNNYKLAVTGLPDNWYYRFVETRGSTDEMAETIVPASSTKSLVLEIVPPYSVEVGNYNFTAVITTPDNQTIKQGLTLQLKSGTSMSVTSDKLAYTSSPGGTFNINVYVTNSGKGGALTNVYPDITAPSGWIVSSSPNMTNSIKAGETQQFTVTVQSPGNIVASDYAVNVNVKSDQAQSASDYRITIATSSYIPYIGGAIILLVGIGLVFMYRKYGRR